MERNIAPLLELILLSLGIISLALLILIQMERFESLWANIMPELAAYLLAYLSVILIPYSLIAMVSRVIYHPSGDRSSSEQSNRSDRQQSRQKQSPDEFHGGAIIGASERSLIFLLFLMSATCILPVKDALGSLAVIIAAKAIFRFNSKTEEAEWYIIGTLLSLIMGVALSWLSLYLIWGRLSC